MCAAQPSPVAVPCQFNVQLLQSKAANTIGISETLASTDQPAQTDTLMHHGSPLLQKEQAGQHTAIAMGFVKSCFL
jgi:hypothetical protein